MATEWVFRSRNEELQETLSRRLNIGHLTARVLINRGMTSLEEARAFLSPDLTDLYDPKLLPDMDLARDTAGKLRRIVRGQAS